MIWYAYKQRPLSLKWKKTSNLELPKMLSVSLLLTDLDTNISENSFCCLTLFFNTNRLPDLSLAMVHRILEGFLAGLWLLIKRYFETLIDQNFHDALSNGKGQGVLNLWFEYRYMEKDTNFKESFS